MSSEWKIGTCGFTLTNDTTNDHIEEPHTKCYSLSSCVTLIKSCGSAGNVTHFFEIADFYVISSLFLTLNII